MERTSSTRLDSCGWGLAGHEWVAIPHQAVRGSGLRSHEAAYPQSSIPPWTGYTRSFIVWYGYGALPARRGHMCVCVRARAHVAC